MLGSLFGVWRAPDRGVAFHWGAAAIWALVILVTAAFARALQVAVSDSVGGIAFTVAVIVIVCFAGIASLAAVLDDERPGRERRVVTLVICAALYAWLTLSLRSAPEEALHFVQYGVLGVLVFRALSVRIGDVSVYVSALAICTLFGIGEEVWQWILPSRFFGFKDIGLNAVGAALALAAIAFGFEPAYIGRTVARRGTVVCVRILIALAVAAALITLATPALVNEPAKLWWSLAFWACALALIVVDRVVARSRV